MQNGRTDDEMEILTNDSEQIERRDELCQRGNVILAARKRMSGEGQYAKRGILYAKTAIGAGGAQNAHYVGRL